MNWEVLVNYQPGASRVHHVRVDGATYSLCGAASILNGWESMGDGLDCHPEDIDIDQRCSVCYSVFERRRREERGLEPVGSQYLPNRFARRKTLAEVMGL